GPPPRASRRCPSGPRRDHSSAIPTRRSCPFGAPRSPPASTSSWPCRALSAAKCFLHLDPARLRGRLATAATIAGAAALGRAVGPEALGHIDLIVAGSVAVDP